MSHEPVDRDVMAFHAQARWRKHQLLFALLAGVTGVISLVRGCSKLAARKDFGTTCHDENDCESGLCMKRLLDYTGHCTKPCTNDTHCGPGARCSRTAGGRYCTEVAADGAPCETDDQCRSRVCKASGRCAESCGRPDWACAEDRYCDRATLAHGCAPRKQDGVPCAQDDECMSGDCASSDTSTMEAALRTRACR